ncbi:MAG TPA: hypothetical protein VE616_00145, partial [Candidatus Udaeobacter sp.]|nr:hypothetical protein [Candidatus Udaeobacter sp.]
CELLGQDTSLSAPPPDPLQWWWLPRSGPEHNLHVPVPAASRARLSVSLARRESRGDTKAGAPKRPRVKEQKVFGLTPVTGHLIIQDTPTCRPEIVKEVAGGFVRLGEKATEVLRRLEERPGFPGAQQHE